MAELSYLEKVYRDLEMELGLTGAPLQSSFPNEFKPSKILIVAPHPDDECLMAALPLRCKNELGTEVFVLPYSLGSNESRRAARAQEMKAACEVLGFRLLEYSNANAVRNMAEAIASLGIDCVIAPSPHDLHPTHIKCANDVLATVYVANRSKKSTGEAPLILIQSEFWGIIPDSNLLVGINLNDAMTIFSALKCHTGEISRNPYHLRLPGYWIDQVRRGSERGSPGGVSPLFVFGQNYKLL